MRSKMSVYSASLVCSSQERHGGFPALLMEIFHGVCRAVLSHLDGRAEGDCLEKVEVYLAHSFRQFHP